MIFVVFMITVGMSVGMVAGVRQRTWTLKDVKEIRDQPTKMS